MSWADSSYSYKKKITIDNTKVAGDETNFPVLVSVTDPDLKDKANGGHVENSNGYDIVFYNNTETTLLNHEIELYTNTSGLIVFWVKVPSLSSTSNTILYMYYGNPNISTDPSSTAVWDANYLGVYHLDEASGATCDDSTSNGNDGTYQGNLPDQQTGKIGYGQDFDGSGDYVLLPSGVHRYASATYECWYESDILQPQYGAVFCDMGDNNNYIQAFPNPTAPEGDGKYWFHAAYGGTMQWNMGGGALDTNYHYWGCAYQTNDAVIYIDNTQIATDVTVTTSPFNYTAVYIGRNTTGTRQADGMMDEFRISSNRRSNNWMNTTYNSQSSPSTFMGFGTEESAVVAPVPKILHAGIEQHARNRMDFLTTMKQAWGHM